MPLPLIGIIVEYVAYELYTFMIIEHPYRGRTPVYMTQGDITANSVWCRLPDIPDGRHNACYIAYNQSLIAIGGRHQYHIASRSSHSVRQSIALSLPSLTIRPIIHDTKDIDPTNVQPHKDDTIASQSSSTKHDDDIAIEYPEELQWFDGTCVTTIAYNSNINNSDHAEHMTHSPLPSFTPSPKSSTSSWQPLAWPSLPIARRATVTTAMGGYNDMSDDGDTKSQHHMLMMESRHMYHINSGTCTMNDQLPVCPTPEDDGRSELHNVMLPVWYRDRWYCFYSWPYARQRSSSSPPLRHGVIDPHTNKFLPIRGHEPYARVTNRDALPYEREYYGSLMFKHTCVIPDIGILCWNNLYQTALWLYSPEYDQWRPLPWQHSLPAVLQYDTEHATKSLTWIPSSSSSIGDDMYGSLLLIAADGAPGRVQSKFMTDEQDRAARRNITIHGYTLPLTSLIRHHTSTRAAATSNTTTTVPPSSSSSSSVSSVSSSYVPLKDSAFTLLPEHITAEQWHPVAVPNGKIRYVTVVTALM